MEKIITYLKKNKILVLVLVMQFFLGLYTFADYPIADIATHAEIVNVLKFNDGFSLDYTPYADVKLTYPLFSHYVALPLSLFMNSIYALRLVMLLGFVAFPLVMYLLGSLFNKRVGLLSLLGSVAVSNYTILAVYSAVPQILAMDFFGLFVYFFFKNQNYLSGLFLGLTVLTHPFIGFVSLVSSLVLLLVYRNKETLKTLGIGVLVSLVMAYSYLQIFLNFIYGRWNNTIHYHLNPGLFGLELLGDFAIRLNPFLLLAAFFALGFKTRVRRFFSIVFLLNLVFVVYHYAPAQLKFLDFFSIPVILLGALTLDKVSSYLKLKSFTVLLAVFFIVSHGLCWLTVYDLNYNFNALSDEDVDSALWLKEHDPYYSNILFVGEGKAETIFAMLANKLPVDATISDLEAYTPDYSKRLEDRKKMLEGDEGLLDEYDVKYIINGDCDKIYANICAR